MEIEVTYKEWFEEINREVTSGELRTKLDQLIAKYTELGASSSIPSSLGMEFEDVDDQIQDKTKRLEIAINNLLKGF